ncbi:UNVERIFIED_CONTAM: hypothetical protein Slati_3816700 [Sesamum latifolium]|uniref:Uncharacterized protein n=1 Tax=Sesamum latifolium TaxID=2727402 RepID=A0AAW2U4W9_9LAMI
MGLFGGISVRFWCVLPLPTGVQLLFPMLSYFQGFSWCSGRFFRSCATGFDKLHSVRIPWVCTVCFSFSESFQPFSGQPSVLFCPATGLLCSPIFSAPSNHIPATRIAGLVCPETVFLGCWKLSVCAGVLGTLLPCFPSPHRSPTTSCAQPFFKVPIGALGSFHGAGRTRSNRLHVVRSFRFARFHSTISYYFSAFSGQLLLAIWRRYVCANGSFLPTGVKLLLLCSVLPSNMPAEQVQLGRSFTCHRWPDFLVLAEHGVLQPSPAAFQPIKHLFSGLFFSLSGLFPTGWR